MYIIPCQVKKKQALFTLILLLKQNRYHGVEIYWPEQQTETLSLPVSLSGENVLPGGSIPKLLSCPLLIIVDLMNFPPSPRLPVSPSNSKN